jgi:peptide/nickel transport system substrate-binding protein
VRRFGLLVAVALAAGCGGAPEEAQPPSAESEPPAETTAADEGAHGGTLRVGLVNLADNEAEQTSPDGQAHYALDPQAEYWSATWELFRCCLLRTLLSYNGTPTAEGGAELRPDLATELPTVSADGLTWTFRLRPGLRYAPPYDETEIVAADVIRAVERTLLPANPSYAEAQGRSTIGAYAHYYMSVIEGGDAFAASEADSISGLEAPDDYTLVVHLTEPAGDLGHRFSLPATAPIPPGAAEGHDDGYGPFLVASGPYMLESYDPGSALKLIRNPSWTASTDLLRAAYADRIELTLAADVETAYAEVENGGLDVVLDQPAPAAIADRYRADPALAPRLIVIPSDRLVSAAMNLAQPPFDDVHVRRAASLAVDKAAIVESFGPGGARIATHAAPDSLEGNLLLDYDPFATPGYRGDISAAREEMAASRYDTDGDGRCDGPACSSIRAIAIDFPGYVPAEVFTLLKRDLAQIGLELEVETPPAHEFFTSLADQTERHALHLDFGWEKDFPNGSGWFSPALDGDDPPSNPSLVGAEAEQLADWGYPVTSVPSVDDEIATCVGLTGGAQDQCWATLDQTVMEQIVPWITYAAPNHTRTISDRVESISIDQLTTLPSLDRIALKEGS